MNVTQDHVTNTHRERERVVEIIHVDEDVRKHIRVELAKKDSKIYT